MDNLFVKSKNLANLIFMIFGQSGAKLGWVDGLYLLRARWPLVLLIGSLVLLVGAVVRSKTPRLHEATVRISLDGLDGSVKAPAAGPEFQMDRRSDWIRQAAELSSRSLLSEVIAPCGLPARWGFTEEEEGFRLLESRLRVESVPSQRLFVVSARDLTREHAAALANVIAGRFVARKESEAKAEASARVRRFERERDECSGRMEATEARLVELAKEEGGSSEEVAELRRLLVSQRNLSHSLEAKRQMALLEAKEPKPVARVVSPATADQAVAVNPPWLGLPGLSVLGLALGIVLALSVRRGGMRWSTVADLMRRLDVPVVGFAPLSGVSVVRMKEAPPSVLEPYRDVRNRLLRLPTGECTLLILMPARRNDPVSEAVANLACVLADAGRTVLVIDADFRRPILHGYFDAAQHPGLSDFLSGEMRLEETVIRSRRPNLWFMPAGPLHADPGGLLGGRRMDDLIWELKRRFDFILIASPSIHATSDAGLLAGLADYTLAATPYLGHSLRCLRETKTALETVSASFAGVLLTTRVERAETGEAPAPEVMEESAPKAGISPRK